MDTSDAAPNDIVEEKERTVAGGVGEDVSKRSGWRLIVLVWRKD